MDISLEAIEQQLTIAAAYEGTARATQALARAQILATLLVDGLAYPQRFILGAVEDGPTDPEPEEDFFAEVRKTHKK